MSRSIEKKIIGAPSFLSLGEIFNSEEIQNFPGKFLQIPRMFRGKNPWKVEEGDQKGGHGKKIDPPTCGAETGQLLI